MAFDPQATTLIDGFGRADGAVDAGAGAAIWDSVGWNGAAGGLVIDTGQVRSGAGTKSQVTLGDLPADMEFRFAIPTADGVGNTLTVFFCHQATDTFYFVTYDSSNGWGLFKRIAGTTTQIGSRNIVDSGGAVANGEQLDIHRVDDVIRVRRYIAGAWVETPILDVTDADIQAAGPIAIEMQATNWRIDDLYGNAAIAETPGGGGGDTGPDEPVTIYVDADDPAASNDWTRAEAANDPTKPFLGLHEACLIARSDPAWPEGDTVLLEPATSADATNVDPAMYPRVHHVMIDGGPTDFLPFGDNDGNPPITIQGNGSIADGTAPKIRGFDGRIRNWVLSDVQQGYDRGSGHDNLTIGTLQVPGDLTFNRVLYTGGGYYITGLDGDIVWNQCMVFSPFSEFHGTGGRFLDGVGNWVRSVDTSDGVFHVGSVTWNGCHFEDIDGEDACQCSLGGVALGCSARWQDCTFWNITQAPTPNAPHTDCIQSLGGTLYEVIRCKFLNCASPFIASDDPNGTIRIENCLIDGPGNGIAGQGTSEWFIRHNTIRCPGFSVAFGGRTPGVVQKIVMVNNNMQDFTYGDAIVHADSVVSNNILTRMPGFTDSHGANLAGLPETGSSGRLDSDDDLFAQHDYELANTPVESAGIGEGVVLDAELGGTLAADLYGRAYANPPDVGCLQSSPGTPVAPSPRAPYVVDRAPIGSGVSPSTSVTARLYPKPGEAIDPSTVTSSSAHVADSGGHQIPAVVSIAGPDEDGYQLLTIDLKSSLSPLNEGELYPLVLYTVTLASGIEDTEGSAIVPTSWEFSIAGPPDGAVYPVGDVPFDASSGWSVGMIA